MHFIVAGRSSFQPSFSRLPIVKCQFAGIRKKWRKFGPKLEEMPEFLLSWNNVGGNRREEGKGGRERKGTLMGGGTNWQ